VYTLSAALDRGINPFLCTGSHMQGRSATRRGGNRLLVPIVALRMCNARMRPSGPNSETGGGPSHRSEPALSNAKGGCELRVLVLPAARCRSPSHGAAGASPAKLDGHSRGRLCSIRIRYPRPTELAHTREGVNSAPPLRSWLRAPTLRKHTPLTNEKRSYSPTIFTLQGAGNWDII